MAEVSNGTRGGGVGDVVSRAASLNGDENETEETSEVNY